MHGGHEVTAAGGVTSAGRFTAADRLTAADRAHVSGRSVLVVLAHPDDESLACGGTLARLAAGGARVILLCATRGERGGPSGPVRNDTLAATRVPELVQAASALGVTDVVLLDHPDGELRWEDVPLFHAEIVAAIRRFQPECLITFGEDGLYWHADHIGVYERVITALRSIGATAPPAYGVTMPRGMIRRITESAIEHGWTAPAKGFWSLNPDAFGLHATTATVVVNVRPWFAQKLAAIQSHESQMGHGHPFARVGASDAEACLGMEHFHRILAARTTAAGGHGGELRSRADMLERLGDPPL